MNSNGWSGLWITLVTVMICNANHTIIIMGPTGVGKSSVINFAANTVTQVAKEGETYDSETFTTTSYNINDSTNFIDTPGLQDTYGYTNEEITELIKSVLIQQSQTSISGVMLMFDAIQNKILLSGMLEGIINIFGAQILENMIVAYNKNDQIDNNRRNSIIQHSVKKLLPVYDEFNITSDDIKQRIIFIDTKGDFDKYSGLLYNGINTNLKGDAVNIIDSDKRLLNDIERHYQMELNDDGNYRIWVEKIAHSQKKTRPVTVNVKTPYNYDCNCHRRCVSRINFIFGSYCTRRKTFCDTCIGHKDVPTEIQEEYVDTWYENVTKKELKYCDDFLHDKATKAVTNIIKNKVYSALRDRKEKKEERKNEL